MSRLRWTSKSSTKLAEELVRQGFDVSSRTVLRLLHRLGLLAPGERQGDRRRPDLPDRDGQFRYINALAAEHRVADGQPGDLGRHQEEGAGRRLRQRRRESGHPNGDPDPCRRVHDFPERTWEQPKVIPYGVYDMVPTRVGSMSASDLTRRVHRGLYRPLVVTDGPARTPTPPGS